MAAAISARDVIGRRRATMLEALGRGGLLLVIGAREFWGEFGDFWGFFGGAEGLEGLEGAGWGVWRGFLGVFGCFWGIFEGIFEGFLGDFLGIFEGFWGGFLGEFLGDFLGYFGGLEFGGLTHFPPSDNVGSEGRSLLRAIASEAVARAEQVLVVLLEVPREQFQEGLNPHVRERLQFQDLFGDPLGWLGRAPPGPGGIFGGVLGGLPSPAPVLLLDSLSWALLREPLPHLCRRLGALLGGAPRKDPPPRIVALLHQELHPPHLLGALGGLARAQLILGGPPETPGAPRRLRLLRDPQKGGGPLQVGRIWGSWGI
uniref:Elongator complex protein 5 n=1 Tax=Taeniopygia guttata TaxID=59729 RepID=A0A674H7B6_TAEGU